MARKAPHNASLIRLLLSGRVDGGLRQNELIVFLAYLGT